MAPRAQPCPGSASVGGESTESLSRWGRHQASASGTGALSSVAMLLALRLVLGFWLGCGYKVV